jgi:Mor family transcriptional regulator
LDNRQQRAKRNKHKLDADAVRSIRREWEHCEGTNRNSLGKKYRVSISTIDAIVKRRIWKEVV